MIKQFNKKDVTILPGIFRERMNINREYLLELNSNCLLQNFYLEAGIELPGLQVVDEPTNAKIHWGWESPTCQLRGHFLGHWLSAASALIASENDVELKVKLDKIVSELARCQQLNGGEWVGSIPEKYFDRLAKNRPIWSPQYVMHKTIMGLTDAYKYAGNLQALEIVNNLADWYIRWTNNMQNENPAAVYSGEQGGMLEAWAILYELTGNEKYMRLVKSYWDNGWFKQIDNNSDALSNDHANAGIPLSHSAAKVYEITGDEKWRRRTEKFWRCAVIERGMYCTSGQNSGEFWIPPFAQGQFLGDNNQEFCTVYNMVRTALYLFRWTGDFTYADYIERCLYNGFLAQHNYKTGMPAYFLPLRAGSCKKWGSRTHDFWCCHGTMIQAQTLYPDLIYFADEENDALIISQYIPSRLKYRHGDADIVLEQTTDMKSYNSQVFFDEHNGGDMSRWSLQFHIISSSPDEFTLSFRIPSWVKVAPVLAVNGRPQEIMDIDKGRLNIKKQWKDDVVQILFSSALVMEKLPDMPELAAVVDGPIVLAGLTDNDCGLVGDFEEPKKFLYPQMEHTYGILPWKQNCYVTRNQPQNVMFKPLYEITDETYTVYFTKK